MPRPADRAVSKSCVNVLKKVKVDGLWKFCPIVKEPNGRLKDRVRVNRQSEIHLEGVYYIEWREGGRRRREAIPRRSEVLESARLKALELDARKAGIEVGAALSDETAGVSVLTTKPRRIGETINNSNQLAGAANFILRGLESYLQAFVSVAVRNELMVQRTGCWPPSIGVPRRAVATTRFCCCSHPPESPGGSTASTSWRR
ncbi:MAG TPA: hypothetical protein VE083_10635 [Terriglobales bacterium]|nr:hypothetical protein [Terriglobales bacterium]